MEMRFMLINYLSYLQATGCLINSISAQMKAGDTLNQAVDAVVNKIQYSVTAFDDAARSLADKIAHSPAMSFKFEEWLHGARSLVTGTWKFRLVPRKNRGVVPKKYHTES